MGIGISLSVVASWGVMIEVECLDGLTVHRFMCERMRLLSCASGGGSHAVLSMHPLVNEVVMLLSGRIREGASSLLCA